jgi:hypothetical protein
MRKHLSVSLAAVLALTACAGGGEEGGSNPPVDPRANATAIAIGASAVGTISTEAEKDWFKFTAPAGGATIRVETFDSGGVTCCGTPGVSVCPSEAWTVDPVIQVQNAAGAILSSDDDSGVPPFCAALTVAVPEGTNYVIVTGIPPLPFDYTLKLTAQ